VDPDANWSSGSRPTTIRRGRGFAQPRLCLQRCRRTARRKRASGDPYFSHPRSRRHPHRDEAGQRLDRDRRCCTTRSRTRSRRSRISSAVRQDIARLVDGVTKLSRIELQIDQTKQAENFRKLVLAMSEDIRVLLVKLADRLHNMRTLHFIKEPDKRRRIARETLEIYAPLAERIGIHRMKDELRIWPSPSSIPTGATAIMARLAFLRSRAATSVEKRAHELRDAGEAGSRRR
jgi:guanosine-3',5'-bis(diphosphate) 3'-pyrophosphohydrolase